jgi:methylated-DNA-[protein]-cysteine S-methyltransferase
MSEILHTPLGRVAVETSGPLVKEIHLGARTRRSAERPSTPVARDLARYFSGEPVNFDDYEVDLTGFTDFQRRVYKETRAIPPGEVRTYGEIARAIGKPGASRAVGNALGRNPACIVIPCHRVVAANGDLGGFTGGLRWKRALLRLEGSDTP